MYDKELEPPDAFRRRLLTEGGQKVETDKGKRLPSNYTDSQRSFISGSGSAHAQVTRFTGSEVSAPGDGSAAAAELTLSKTVHLYTRSCHECQRRKKPPTRPAGLLQPISPPTAPFQQIGMDLLGPFPPSTSGNRWIIVATDYLTRYAETKALPSGTAVEVAKFFIESIVLRHGAPEVLITDRGSSFMAQLTQEILRLSHTSHRRTTAYHPQTNGLTERLNKTIADMISMYVDVEHKTWDEVLPYVTFAYNTAVQETTGFTPFQLVHGRKVTTMLDAMLPHEPSDNESDDAQAVAQPPKKSASSPDS
ncbi:DDE-type integrase/transposase/recombinase [Ixodes scapularis]